MSISISSSGERGLPLVHIAELFCLGLGTKEPLIRQDTSQQWCVGRMCQMSGRKQSDQVGLSSSTWLQTGGTGALGTFVAHWLMQSGAATLSLLSRSGNTVGGAEAHWIQLTNLASSCSVQIDLCDVGCDRSINRAVECTHDRLGGVIHSAGVISDAALLQQTQNKLRHVWSPKAQAAYSLHEACSVDGQSLPFIMFSSAAALMGNAGQSSYAAANTFLDVLAMRRRAADLSAVSIQWGMWGGAGMAVQADVLAQLTLQGVGAMAPEVGIAALRSILHSQSHAVVSVAVFHWPVLLNQRSHTPPFLARLAHRKANFRADSAQSEISTRHAHCQNSELYSTELLESLLLEKLHDVSGEHISIEQPLMDAGIDSLAATELRNELQSELIDVRLPTTLVFDHPSGSAIVNFVQAQFNLDGSVDRRAVCVVDSVLAQQRPGIASTACYAPGRCTSSDEFWHLLASSQDPLQAIPFQRFDANALDSSKLALRTKVAHFVQEAQLFDHLYFRTSSAEASAMDPHQRLLLEVSYSAMFTAAVSRNSAIGVFVGVMTDGEWSMCQQRKMQQQNQGITAFAASSVGAAALVGRISFVLSLKGPCISVNTVCSSSLVALDAAAQNLQLGRCQTSLVAGVNLVLDCMGFLGYGQALAADGSCKTFDSGANGLGRGEACSALILQVAPVHTQPVLSGSAVNQDGRSASMTAPNGPSQVELLRSTMADQSEPHGIETHGTGTALGDPIELGALRAAFGKHSHLLTLGALKTRFG